MSNSNNWLSRKIAAFKKMPKEDKTTFFVFALLITLLIAAIVIAVVLISTMKNKPKPVNSLPVLATADSENLDADYNAKDYVIDDEKFKDTLLPLSEDAGKKYLEDTLFVGDSNTQRLFTYGLCTLQNVLAQEGMSVGGVTSFAGFYFQGMENGVTIPRAIAMLQPRRIVFNFGTNNAGNSMKSEEFIKAYSDALLAIKAEYPYTDIILATIPPVGEKRDYNNVSMKAIDAFNEAIVNYAQKEGYKVLNYNEFLKDEDTGYIKAEYVVGDGLHLTQEALKKQLKFVRTHAYETEDTRPKLKAIPQRRKSPVVQTASPTDGETSTENKENVIISFLVETQTKAGKV
ncbi:MAG: GDSL-type esterase/lipase family protein, partial [Oscillospiraceae bacterium]